MNQWGRKREAFPVCLQNSAKVQRCTRSCEKHHVFLQRWDQDSTVPRSFPVILRRTSKQQSGAMFGVVPVWLSRSPCAEAPVTTLSELSEAEAALGGMASCPRVLKPRYRSHSGPKTIHRTVWMPWFVYQVIKYQHHKMMSYCNTSVRSNRLRERFYTYVIRMQPSAY